MTWHHVFIIAMALAAPLVCGLSPACANSLPGIIQLATIVIGGALGHAGAAAHVKTINKRDNEKTP